MNKTMRFLLVLAVLVAVVVVAGGASVWAGPAAQAPQAVAANQAPAVAAIVGSTIPADLTNDCSSVVVVETDTKGVCSLARVTGLGGSTDVVASVSGGAVELQFAAGSADICFAAPKNGVIQFKADKNADTWTDLVTRWTAPNGPACATVSASGFYQFVQNP